VEVAMIRGVGMARAYSNDLRKKFFEVYDEGEETLEEVAERLRVSVGWAKKISARRTRTGEITAPQWQHGPKPRVTGEIAEWLGEQIRRQPDLTLRELAERLAESQGVQLSPTRIWWVLRRLQLPLKKNRSMPRSKIVNKRSSAGKHGGPRSVSSKWSS
jgi:transposase